MAALYATGADFLAYVAGTVAGHQLPTDGELDPPGAAIDRLLEQAELDVDRACGGAPHPLSRRRFTPALLAVPQQEALARATCAAAEFRLLQGEGRLVGADHGIEQAGALTLARTGSLPRRSPKVLEELAGFGLIGRAGTPTAPLPPVA